MKKNYLVLTFTAMLFVTSAFADPDPDVTKEVEASFKREFAGSQLLAWTQQGEFYKATFIMAGCRTEAYFTEDGELHGSIRGLFYNQLPLAVITRVDKRFESVEVIDVCEINNGSGTNYRITLDSNEKRYRVKVDSDGNITDIEKLKK